MRKYHRKSMCSGYLRFGKIACNMCEYNIMGSYLYVIIVGLIGTAITAIDLMRILNFQTQDKLCLKIKEHGIEMERDLKLMTSILGIEHYTLMMLGAITNYPMLHVPWLLMQLCVIAVEVFVFLVRLFMEGPRLTCDEIILSLFTIHNWLQVFCLFHNQIRLLTA